MRSATVRDRRPAGSSEKLALLEALLGIEEPAEAATRTMAWLAEHAGLSQGRCVLIDCGGRSLTSVADYGVSPLPSGGLPWIFDSTRNPLIQAIDQGEPRFITGRARMAFNQEPPLEMFGATSYWALPLTTVHTDEGSTTAMLLAVMSSPPTLDVVAWATDVLGKTLQLLRSRQLFSGGEKRLRSERSRLQTIIDSVGDPILLTDTYGRLLIANAQAETLFSTTADKSEGHRRAVELNTMFLSAALWRIAVGTGDTSPQELVLVAPADGSDLIFELQGTLVHDLREGTGIVSVLRDVTDLHRAAEELAENLRRVRLAEAEARGERDRLNLIIDSVADPILVSDPEGRVTMMNAPAERLFTTTSKDEHILHHVRTNDAQFSSIMSGLLSDGSVAHKSAEVMLTDVETGAPLPLEAIVGKSLSDRGELTAVVTILHDRSEVLERARLYDQVKRTSEELEAKVAAATAELARQNELLRQQAAELEQASAMKSQFLATISHELRTPLNAVLGYTSMLLQGVSGELAPAQRKSLERIGSNGRHLLGIINEILDLVKIESGRMPLQLTTFSLVELVAEVRAEMEPIVARSGLIVNSYVSPGLGLIKSDRQKIKQIMVNLLSNALKFTPSGSVTVRVGYDDTPGNIAIAVADTGVGISQADMERVFEEFRQADGLTARPVGGTGLGLSICRRLATMLGGRISLESEVGVGSTFTLSIPNGERA